MNIKLTLKEKKKIINELLERINNMDFYIIPTVKNKEFVRNYRLTYERAN